MDIQETLQEEHDYLTAQAENINVKQKVYTLFKSLIIDNYPASIANDYGDDCNCSTYISTLCAMSVTYYCNKKSETTAARKLFLDAYIFEDDENLIADGYIVDAVAVTPSNYTKELTIEKLYSKRIVLKDADDIEYTLEMSISFSDYLADDDVETLRGIGRINDVVIQTPKRIETQVTC